MAKVRCKQTNTDSFFGNFLYDQKVSRNHFLRKLSEVIDWSRFTKRLLRYYRGKGEVGQAPYNPALLLRMLLLSYLWNVSERMVEELANDSLSIGLFLGLGADEKAPDHSTLTLFKNRLIENAGAKAYEQLFDEIVRIAQEKGVKFGKLQIVDSVHLVANVNVEKDLGKGIKVGTVAGDKGYDDGENHYYLKERGINSAIRLNNYRIQKKDGNKGGWLRLQGSQAYIGGLKERYKVERKFGEARKWHGYTRVSLPGIHKACHTELSYLYGVKFKEAGETTERC